MRGLEYDVRNSDSLEGTWIGNKGVGRNVTMVFVCRVGLWSSCIQLQKHGKSPQTMVKFNVAGEKNRAGSEKSSSCRNWYISDLVARNQHEAY